MACSSPPETWPARTVDGLDMDIPEIRWPHGAPDTSDPWVRALIDGFIAEAAATNNHDLSPAGLRHYLTDDWIDMLARYAWGSTTSPSARETSAYMLYPGPHPIRVDSVTPTDTDDAATITVCLLWWGTKEREATGPETFGQKRTGRATRYQLVRGEDGHIRLDRAIPSAMTDCPLGSARPGFFHPKPDFGSPVKRPDLIMPDGTPRHRSPHPRPRPGPVTHHRHTQRASQPPSMTRRARPWRLAVALTATRHLPARSGKDAPTVCTPDRTIR